MDDDRNSDMKNRFALKPAKFRIADKPDEPFYKLVDGLVSPSGVFGINRRRDIEQEIAKEGVWREGEEELWVVTHIPTGTRIGFQLSYAAAARNAELLELDAEDMNRGELGQVGEDIFDEKTRQKLLINAKFAEHAAELEFKH